MPIRSAQLGARDPQYRRTRIDIRRTLGAHSLSLDLIERFLDAMLVERGLSPATLRSHRSYLLQVEAWLRRSAGRTLVTARSESLTRYLRALAREASFTGASRSSLTRRHRCLRLFYSWLRAIGAREDDPMGESKLGTAREFRRILGPPSANERAMREAIRERNSVMFLVMLFYGLQARDLVALKVRDAGLRGLGAGTVSPECGLSANSRSPALTELLTRYIEGAREMILEGRSSEYLFPSRSGSPLKERTYVRSIRYLSARLRSRVGLMLDSGRTAVVH
jgi:Site-specific recombinase XerD